MEETIVHFIELASELILANRIDSHFNYISKKPNDSKQKLQLQSVPEKKSNFKDKISQLWSEPSRKVIVLELYLISKRNQNDSKDKLLVEQWIFESSESTQLNWKNTINSIDKLKLKLTVLLRSISVLCLTLPLHQIFMGENISEYFEISFSVKNTFDSKQNWPLELQEGNIISNYANEDIIVPGRMFSFRANYIKDLDNFISKILLKVKKFACLILQLILHNREFVSFQKKLKLKAISDLRQYTKRELLSVLIDKLTNSVKKTLLKK